MKHGKVLPIGIIMAALLGACNNFFHELVPPDGNRITSFRLPGQVRAAMISDDSVMITLAEGANVRSLLPEIVVSPRATVLPVTFNYLQTAFPSEDILKAAAELYSSDNPAAYIENLVRKNKDFKIPALNIPIDFFAPVDVYVISAMGGIRRYTVFVSVENETNPGGGIEWPRLLGMGFSKLNNPGLHADSLCWIVEDRRSVSATVKYMPDSDFSFALVPTFVIWGDRMEIDGNEITSDESVIQFNGEPGKQSKVLTLWRGNNSLSYTLDITFTEDLGVNGPMLEGLRFAKYDNPELVIDAVCNINENSLTVNARAFYPVEMPYLSFALAPSFEILGERLLVDGEEVRSGDETSVIQFTKAFGTQNKTLTVWRNGRSKDYTLTVTFEEDPDTVRSITDFRFAKQDNSNIAANAVASIVNTDNTGAITVQVFYSGAKPSSLVPRFVSPGTVSVSGATQTSGVSSQDFSSALEYRVVSRNGQFVRTYTVRVEYISLADVAPRITSFRFSQNLNHALTQDSDGEIRDDTAFIIINAYYGGAFPPEQITPEFSAEGLVQVMGGVQVSSASPQDFSRPVKYTVVHPLNSVLRRDYWVYTTQVQDTASHAVITAFSFRPDDNPGLRDELTARIDQGTGKITVFAPIGSGLTARTMYPRFTAAGQVSVGGTVQVSGASAQMFNSPVVYTVVSDNGLNRRDYTVEVRELMSTMYVNQNAVGSGDGTSWENAFRFLQTACEAADQFPQDVPKEIWIAKGSYAPANIDDYFRLTPNTSYIGGFAGYETAKSQRNITANTVTVSGSLGGGIYARHIFAAVSELNGDLSFENLRLSGARGQQGTCINAPIDAASEIAVTDCVFSDMETSGAGGAVYVRGGGAVISRSAFSACNNGAVYVQGAGAAISDVEFSNCNNGDVLKLDCSGDTDIKRVSATDSSANAFYLGGNGNKTLETVTVNRGSTGLNVQNTAGYVRVNGLVMRDLTGAGININNVTGVKYLSGVTARNINGNAIYCAVSSGSFTLTGSSIFDNTGIVSISNGSGAVSVLNTEIKNSKGSSALDISTSGNSVIDAVNIDGVSNGRGIYITSDGNAAITNTVIKNCGGTGMYLTGSGNVTMEGGTISGNTGNGVFVGSGIFTMAGGTISGNSSHGVQLNNGTFTMAGGTISGNTGYGLRVADGTFTMDGGTISGNLYCGVYVSIGTFTMEGGTISGNDGHGVYVSGASATFTMDGGTISGNTSNGVTVYYGTFIMKSGTISGNNHGVYLYSGNFTMESGTISGNTGTDAGGGVCLFAIREGTFIKTGGTIYGYDGTTNANTVRNASGVLQNNMGHAIYVNANKENSDGSGIIVTTKRKETTAGPGVNLSFVYADNANSATYSGGWDY